MLLSAANLLAHIGLETYSQSVRNAIQKVISEGQVCGLYLQLLIPRQFPLLISWHMQYMGIKIWCRECFFSEAVFF